MFVSSLPKLKSSNTQHLPVYNSGYALRMESTWLSYAPRLGKRGLSLGTRVSALWILSACLALPIAVIDLSWPLTPQTAEAIKMPPRGAVSFGGSTDQLLALEDVEPETESAVARSQERGKGKARPRKRRSRVRRSLQKLFKGQTIANQRRRKLLAREICNWHVFERYSAGAPSKLLIFLTTAGQKEERSGGCCGMSKHFSFFHINKPKAPFFSS